MFKKLLLSSILIICSITFADNWERVYPKITTEDIYCSTNMGNSNKIIAGGSNGLILISEDGESWDTIIDQGLKDHKIKAIDFPSQELGFLATEDSKIFKTDDSGSTWSIVNYFSNLNYNNIDFIDENLGYICCDDGKIVRTEDGGESWSEIDLNQPYHFRDIEFSDDGSIGFIVGGNYEGGYCRSDYSPNSWSNDGIILKSSDLGTNWEILLEEEKRHLNCINIISNNTAHFGGGYVESTSGDTTSVKTYGYILNYNFSTNQIEIELTDKEIYQITGFNNHYVGFGWFRYFEHTINSLESERYLVTISYGDPSNIGFKEWKKKLRSIISVEGKNYLFGDAGLLEKHLYGHPSSFSNFITSDNIIDIETTENKIFILADYPLSGGIRELFISGDNGSSWTKSPYHFSSDFNAVPYSNISMTSDNSGFYVSLNGPYSMVGCRLNKTTNGGSSWEDIAHVDYSFESYYLDFIDESIGFLFNKDNKSLLKYVNGEITPLLPSGSVKNYTSLFTGGINALFVYSGTKIDYSLDFGDSWNEVRDVGNQQNLKFKFNLNTSVYVTDSYISINVNGEETIIESYEFPYFNSINEIFVPKDGIILITTNDGKIVKSSNCGKSWSIEYANDENKINDISFKNNGNYITAYGVSDNGSFIRCEDITNPTTEIEEALKYYPLNSGDIYRYFQVESGEDIKKITTIIGEDEVKPNGKTYKLNGDHFERVDPNSANVYRYIEDSQTEVLIDSLLAMENDKYKSWRSTSYHNENRCQVFNIDLNTICGTETLVKYLAPEYQLTNGISLHHKLGKGFGLVERESSDLFGGYYFNKSLVYAKVDGVEYKPEPIYDYYMYDVGNRWEYHQYDDNNTLIGYKSIFVESESDSSGVITKNIVEHRYNSNMTLLTELNYEVSVDPLFNCVDYDIEVGETVSYTIFNIETKSIKRLRLTIPNQYGTERRYCKYFGMVSEDNIDNDTKYILKAATIGGVEYGLETGVEESNLVNRFKISQNYPNPFNPSTTIEYHLPTDMDIYFTVYNIAGKVVYQDQLSGNKGINSINFDGSHLSSGQYFYRVVAGDKHETKKMLMLK